MAEQLVLKVGGEEYTGWEAVRVASGIDQLAGEFELGGADRWALSGQASAILPGLPCSIEIAGTPVITGWIDDDAPSYDARSHSLTLRGRDATGDLVDSAALADGMGWENRTIAEIAADLCKPFGIPVTVSDDVAVVTPAPQKLSIRAPLKSHRINPGETVFEVLSRAAALRGALLISDQQGGLLITRAGGRRSSTVLQRGVNILSGSALHSHRQRFHTYQVIAQQSGAGQAFSWMPSAQHVEASTTDPAIRAQRRTVIVVSDSADAALAKQVASWARANAAAVGERATVWVPGWLDGGEPWRPNTLVHIEDDYLRVSGTWLIAQVEFLLDPREGELTALTLAPPAAYVPQPQVELDPADEEVGP
ncbi:MAG: hypothetical protein QJR02_08390 [Sinobacteraceae bacterium]|nr:hypothetical protein [Nevskiaceae bacterium]